MATLSVGNPSNDEPSSGQRVSYKYRKDGPDAGDHVHTLIKAFENLIIPIIHSHVPPSGSFIGAAKCTSNLGPEAEQLVDALETFVAALVRSQLAASEPLESNKNTGPDTQEETTTSTTVQPSVDPTTPVSQRLIANSEEQSLLILTLEEARHRIFNTMPIRLLAFKQDGSGIELMERSAIWHRISTVMETDLDEGKIKHAIELEALKASKFTSYITEEEKQKAGINSLVSAYTKYAILSHTWLHHTPGEITYANWQSGDVDFQSPGYQKLANFCRVAAAHHDVQFGWMDTVCINKESSSELDESIRSMFRWYRDSNSCVTYLSDTTALQHMCHDTWFTRGWTLQELLAPSYIKFYGADWKGIVPGLENDKTNVLILEEIHVATTITRDELECVLEDIPISRRMQWAANRRVTREEDMAYSLMGIFDISISTAYGEGSGRAFVRLVKGILTTWTPKVLDILNWGYGPSRYPSSKILERTSVLIPTSPREYLWRADRTIRWFNPINPVTLTHIGLHVPVLLMYGVSVGSLAPDDFDPIGNYYASAKNIVFLSAGSGTFHRNYHLLEKTQSLKPSAPFDFFGVMNFLETANAVELPAEGGCFAVPLAIHPPPTAVGVLPKDFVANRIMTARPIVFDLQLYQTETFIIPKTELERHGMTLRTLYL